MSVFAKYVNFRRAFVEEVEVLVDAGQKKVLNILGIKQELWDQSIKHYHEENKQEIILLPMLIIDKLKYNKNTLNDPKDICKDQE